MGRVGVALERAGRRRTRARRLGWAAALVVFLAVLGVVGLSVYVGWTMTHLENEPVSRNPAELGLTYERVEFSSSDGITLRGWFLPAGDRSHAVVFVHGFDSNRLQPTVDALSMARSFVESGFSVLMFDLRNSGESGGDVTTLGYHEAKDVRAAVEWLKRERAAQAQRIGVIGSSMGAATAILAAAGEPAIEAVVADSAFSDLRSYLAANMSVWTGLPDVPFTWMILALLPPLVGLEMDAVSPMAAMPRLEQPILLIHADGDSIIPPSNSKALAAAGHPDRTHLWIAPGERHIGARRADPAAYDARVIGFFRETLGEPHDLIVDLR